MQKVCLENAENICDFFSICVLVEISKDLVVGPVEGDGPKWFLSPHQNPPKFRTARYYGEYYASCPYLLKVDVSLLVKVLSHGYFSTSMRTL